MKTRFWHSLSFRLALAYAALLCVSMGLLAAAYYWIAVARPLDEIQRQVGREARQLARVYEADGQQALLEALQHRQRMRDERRAFHAFIAPDGRLIDGNLPSWPSRPAKGWFSIEADIYREGGEQDFSALSFDRVFSDGARLIVGRDAENIEDRDEAVVMVLPWLFGLTLLFGLLGGLVMSRAIGRRLDVISATARQVIAGDLGGRVAIRGSGDDFDRLAGTLNAMLARNQELFEAVRRVSDNVAHELRTPLARLVARLEALELKCGEAPESRAGIEAALAEANRLQVIFNALLRIARLEGGQHDGGAFRQVNLSTLATDAVELYAPAAEAKGIALRLEAKPGVRLWADRDLLFQAIVNLLDNALKYTPDGGTVRTGVDSRDGLAVISVADSGDGLRPEEAARVTERFFRGASAQGRPGEGLGLSLVAAIASLHHASLDFRDAQPGLCVELALPVDAQPTV